MRDKLLAQLIAKYPGVSKKFLGLWADKLAAKVTEETQIEGAISELDNLPVSITDLATEFQKEGDNRVDTARKEWLNNPPKPNKPVKTDDPKPNDPPKDDEMPSWFKPFAEKMQAIESEKAITSIRGKITEKLKDVPVDFYNEWALPQSETEIDSFVEKVQAKHTAYEQSIINKSLGSSGKPIVSNPGKGTPDQKEIDAIVDDIL